MFSVHVEKQLDKFSLQVELGVEKGLTVLLGPSGCGKSTLLNLVAGLLRPDKGEIILNGRCLFRSPGAKQAMVPVHRRQIGYVFQQATLFPHLSIKNNILYGLRPGHARKQEYDQLVSILRLEGLEERLPKHISGGQGQRVALARALITHPQALLLDEPFSALDNFIRRKLRREVLNVLERYDIPAILVTHDLEEAVMLGDKIAVMDSGHVLACGSPRDIFSRPSSRKVARFMGMANIFDGAVKRVMPGGELQITGEKFDIILDSKDSVPLQQGQSLVFGIRPENILYLPPEKVTQLPENTLRPTIVSILTHGPLDHLLLRVTRDDYDLEMLLPHHVIEKRGLRPGQSIEVSLPRKFIRILEVL